MKQVEFSAGQSIDNAAIELCTAATEHGEAIMICGVPRFLIILIMGIFAQPIARTIGWNADAMNLPVLLICGLFLLLFIAWPFFIPNDK